MEGVVENEETSVKKGRHRKKQLYTSILKQMEFYFSDSNLTKDRFLSQLIEQDNHVDLQLFLKCNKIRKLTTNLEDIRKALRKSELIEVSEDGTRLSRKLPIKVKENVEECTIYVEQLKPDATHDWVKEVFSEFGTVVYVSIPKYRNNGVIKGFAFVEFDTEEGANATLQHFESINCKIPSSMEPDKLMSISTFEPFDNNQELPDNNQELTDENQEPLESGTKRKIEEDDEPAGVTTKKLKTEEEEEETKKKRPKKNKKSNVKDLGLQILSKKEWKKLRNRYLDMQKKAMRQLKQHLNRQRFAYAYKEEPKEPANPPPPKKPEVCESGTIVKIQLCEPCYEHKKLKQEIKGLSTEVKFVDIPLPAGSQEIFVRFASGKGAESFCESEFKGKLSILTGEEEGKYWEKIESCKEEKMKKEKRSNKQRGRDKLLKKAEQLGKHIHFDDEECDLA